MDAIAKAMSEGGIWMYVILAGRVEILCWTDNREVRIAELTVGDFRLGIVDVPGHERFVRNMLAGAAVPVEEVEFPGLGGVDETDRRRGRAGRGPRGLGRAGNACGPEQPWDAQRVQARAPAARDAASFERRG